MTAVNYALTAVAGLPSPLKNYSLQWTPLTHTNTSGVAWTLPAGFKVQAYDIRGTFDSATVVLQASVDGTNYVTVLDNAAAPAAISKTSAAVGGVQQIQYPFWKCSHSGGTSAESLTITLFVVKT